MKNLPSLIGPVLVCAGLLLTTLPTATSAQCTRTDRFDLSSSAAQVLSDIETNSYAFSDSPVGASRLLSTCNRFVSLEIDGPDIFAAARDIIATADHEVDLAFFDWQNESQASDLIGDGLIAAQVRRTPSDPLLVRILIDDVIVTDFSRVINHLYDSEKEWETRGLDTSRVQLQFGTVPRATQASPNFHDKYVIVDGRMLLITGANVQLHNDPAELWHDSGYVLEGDVALSALEAFEDSWNDSATEHWECSPQPLSADCDERPHFPQPAQGWLPAFGSQVVGNIPVLMVGRTKGGTFSNDTNNPQDIAWSTLMAQAQSHIYIETPNINDDAFRAQVVAAVSRGVEVRLITGLGFNGNKVDLPSLGGSNLEVIGNLRKEIRATVPQYQHLFKVRWYGQDGREPITDNGNGASHTKYLSVDSQIAVVGSGNQDTISWNIAHELNVLIDDAATTASIENALFLPDWNGSVEDYLELYEGNNGTQDIVCPIMTKNNTTVAFNDQPWYDPIIDAWIDTWRCNNDEARSLLLHEVDAGKVFRFYDSPSRAYQDDDWTEIVVKRPLTRKYISSFEQSFEDADVLVTYHRDNGLDGKISAAEVATATAGPIFDLYEGNSATQSLVCSIQAAHGMSLNFQSHAYCNNDEARSLVLSNFPEDMAVFLYDDPGGGTGDDWTVIVPKRHITRATVSSFESSSESADFKVCAFPNNGLDGKVSRLRIGSLSEAFTSCSPYGGTTVSAGKSYTLSPAPSGSYPDSGGELTNGTTVTGASWPNAAGWLYVDPTITLDLGQSYNLSEVQIVVGNSYGNGTYGVARPANVAVSTSHDGVHWTSLGNLSFVAYGAVGTKDQIDLGRASVNGSGRWVRYSVSRGGAWTMVTELIAKGTPASPPGGVPYTLSPAPASNYPDSGNELSDDVTATGESWVNAAGWLYVDPTITLDLGQSESLASVLLYVGNSHGNGSFGVARPASAAVSVSNNGVSWSSVGNLSFGVYSAAGTKEQVDRGILSLATTGRWVRISIARGGAWTMVTEVDVVTSEGGEE